MYIRGRKLCIRALVLLLIITSFYITYLISTATQQKNIHDTPETTTSYISCSCGHSECADGVVCYYDTIIHKKPLRPTPHTETSIEESVVAEPTDESKTQETQQETSKPAKNFYGRCYVTGYCTGACCCGKWAGTPTASGLPATAWKTVAMYDIPFGTRIYIDGLGEFVVEDRGVGAGKVDICVGYDGDHADAYKITGYYDVYILD